MRIKLTISYIGTNYSGFQSQPNKNTIQDKVEYSLSQFFGGKNIRIYGAGRTDVGVHANGQVAHFDVDENDINCHKLCLGVNLHLPNDISVVGAEVVEENFDARFSAVCKTYIYRMYISSARKPLLDINHYQVYKPIDIDRMQQAGKLFVGKHDFAGYQATGSNIVGTVRTIDSLEVVSNVDDTIYIVVSGQAFLYNMVRIIAGVLLAVGQGEITLTDIENSINNQKRLQVKTLPSVGLTLEAIEY